MRLRHSFFLIAIFLFLFVSAEEAFAANYYSRISGNWGNAATWSTVGCGGVASSTAPAAGDNVTICAGHTVNGNVNATILSLNIQGTLNWSAARTVTVTGNLVMNGGTITGTRTGSLNVAGTFTTSATNSIGRSNLTITGATTIASIVNITSTTGTKIFNDFIISAAGTFNNSVNDNFEVDGNFQNNGTFAVGTGRVTFGGASSKTLTGSSISAFSGIIINKGTSAAVIFDVQSVITLTSGGLTLTNGTFKLSNSSINLTPFSVDIGGAPYLIPSTAGLWCNGATVNSGNMNWTVAGLLRVSTGTVTIGNTANNNFRSANGGTTQLIVEGGTLNVAGSISRRFAADFMTSAISGGTIVVPAVGLTTAGLSPIQLNQAGGTFTMTAGVIDIRRSGATNLGFTATAGTVSISGGIIQIGDASTPAIQTILVNSAYNISSLTVNSANATCQLSASLTVLSAVTINSGILNANNLNMTVGGIWANSGTFTPGAGTVTFNGTGTQTITKSGGETFNNVTINKTSGTVTLANNVNVNSTLTMTAGNIDCLANTLTLGVSTVAAGTLTYTAGTIIGNFKRWKNSSAGALLFPVGTAAYYRSANLTFTTVIGGTLTANFVSTDPGSSGLPLSESGFPITNQFTEGYWDLTAANGLSSVNYNIDLTGNGFSSYAVNPATRVLYRALASNPWSLNGTHVAGSGNTASRSGVNGLSAQFCFGKTTCSTYSAASIAGNTTVCISTSQSYSVTNTSGNTYTWVITGGSVGTGQGTNSISVNWGAAGMNGNVQVTEKNTCSVDNLPVNLPVTINPIATSAITGSASVSTNETGVAYSVTNNAGYSYAWSIAASTGGAIASGQGTNSVSINWGATAGTYTVKVTTTRLCGAPDVQNLTVTVRNPFYSRGNGSWNTNATWSNVACGGAGAGATPGVNDEVIICAGHTITMNGNPGSCRKLTINGTANWTQARTTNVGAGGIIINSTGNITGVAAGVLTSSGGLTGTSNGNISSTTVTIRLQTTPQNIKSDGALNLLDITTTATNTGTVTIANNGTLSGAGTLTQSANSALNMNGSTFSLTTLNASATGNTVNYGGNAVQSIKSGTYHHLIVSGSGIKTLSGIVTINGDLTISSPTATFDVSTNNYALSVAGNWSNAGTFDKRFGTVTFNGSSLQTLSNAVGLSFNNLAFSGAGTKQINNALTIEADFTNGSTFNAGTNAITAKGNFDNSGSMTLNNDVTFSNNTTISGSSITTFKNVIITGTLAGHSSNMNVTGSWTNNGTFNHNNGTVTFIGTTTISGTGINNFGEIAISGALTAPAANINVAKNFTNNGTFNHNNGTVNFNGTAVQSIGGSAVTNFYNITQNNSSGVNLAKDVALISALTITSGTFSTSGYLFTLKSNAAGTARIAPIPVAGNIAGNITMERYSGTGPTDWRFLTSSVDGATIADWADDFTTTGFTGAACNPSNCGSPGCAATCNWPSIYLYDETKPGDLNVYGYVPATNVTNSISNGNGFWVYLGPTPVTIKVTGPPKTFSQSPSLTYTNSGNIFNDGWNLIANPYPSAIDWDSPNWAKANLDNAIYIYNSYTGSFASYVGGIGINGGSRYVPSSQAYWVKANGVGTPSVTAVENVKASANPTFMKMGNFANTSHYPMAFKDFPIPQNINNKPNSILLTASGGGYDDETFIQFVSGATTDFDGMLDARKLQNTISISSVISDTVDYSINSLPELNSDVAIKIRLRVSAPGTYSIRRDSLLMLPMSSCIMLEDLASGNWIDLRHQISYSFSISDTTSAPRFILHITVPVLKTKKPASCENSSDGMAIAQGSGVGPWNYIWTDSNGDTLKTKNNSFSADTLLNLPSGIYTVEVSGTICGAVKDTITISAPLKLEVWPSFSDVSCKGFSDGMATVTVAGGTVPYSYLWSNGATTAPVSNLPEGNYSISVIDANGCSSSFAAAISSPVVADFSPDKDTLYIPLHDTAFFYNSSSGAIFYQWDFGDTSAFDSTKNPAHFYNYAGTYTVTLIASDSSCYDTISYTVIVLDTLLNSSVSGFPAHNSFQVGYENGEVFLSFDLPVIKDIVINVYNPIGEKVMTQKIGQVQKNNIRLETKDLSEGVYIVVADMNEMVLVRKFILLTNQY